jgi:hypothetical protein
MTAHPAQLISMPLDYKDFFPTVLKSGFFSTTHEELPATVERASKWIQESGVHLVNVETVVLPNIHAVEEASQVGIRTSGEISSHWYQVVRVWYESSSPAV